MQNKRLALIPVFILCCCFFALGVLSADQGTCVEPAKLVRTWGWYEAKAEVFQDEATVAVKIKALDAGAIALDELVKEGGIGAEESLMWVELLDQEVMEFSLAWIDPIGLTQNEEFITGRFSATLQGTWQLDCATVTLHVTAVKETDIVLENPTEEQKLTWAPKLPRLNTDVKQELETRLVMSFSLELSYLGEHYALGKDLRSDQFIILQEKIKIEDVNGQ